LTLRSLVLALLAVLLAAPSAPPRTPLEAALKRALGAKALQGARVSALVVDVTSGEVLFAQSPDRAMVPASNLKILTALVALETFGPSHRFTTRVLADAAPDAEGAVDTLYLQGGGDPTLTSESWWRLAADLRLAGLRRVRRGLVVDDSAFDGVRWHPAWGTVTSRAYYAPVGALTANYGAFAVQVEPGRQEGDPVRVVVDPPVDFLRVVNRAHSGAPGSASSLSVGRVAGQQGDEVRVSGRLPAGGEGRRLYRSVSDPARYAAAVARLQLEAHGIRVGPEFARSAVPPQAQELLAFEGRPLAEIVQLLVKYSNNSIAEALLKSLGARDGGEGTWSRGSAVLAERLETLGLDTQPLELVDGSGLATRNRVTPRALVGALRKARDSFRVGPELVASLPIAAHDGTLKKRANGASGRVRAKTGLLDGVTGLSGFAQLADGREAAFSVHGRRRRRSRCGHSARAAAPPGAAAH
jgi:D-alanyl-D-alanine carboxypeptidase/D-alanyl-D-alanine-endopeptidase (penicillin-binding protein 4)